MFWYKLHNARYDIVLAACDDELLGRNLKGGGIKINVSEDFYKGSVIGEAGMVRLMRLSTIGNLIGKRIVSLAEREGFVANENVLFIGEVPHAQFVKIH